MFDDEVRTRFKELGIELRNGQYKTTCPRCSKGRKKSSDEPLSVNRELGVWTCHHCGWASGVGGASINQEEKLDWLPEEIELPEYDPENHALTDEVVEWFEARGISIDTLNANMVGAGLKEGQQYIAFPYYLEDEIVRVKYRLLGDKSFWQSPGLKTFYGLDDFYTPEGALKFKEAFIVEGELDKLAMNEVGYWNVLSVPDGAPAPGSGLAKKLSYLESEAVVKFFEKMDAVILATDSDEPGQYLANELARRTGAHKAFRVQFPEGLKDANEVLIKLGAEALTEVMTAKRAYPVEGTFEVVDFKQDIHLLYTRGVQPGLSSGYGGWDKIATFEQGRLNIWTGAPNSGKSEFLDDLTVQMARIHDLKVAVFSPESYPPEKHFRRIAQKLIGKPFGKPGQRDRMSLEELAYAERWAQEHIKWIQPANPTPERVIEAAKNLILRDGISVLVVDPWNNMRHDPGALPFTQYISQKLDLFRELARQYKLIFHLVVHPRKLTKRADGSWEVPTAYDLKDASEWFEKADNIFSVWRCPAVLDLPVEVHQQKGKDAEIVRPCTMGLFSFDWRTTRYTWLKNSGASLPDENNLN